MADVSITATEVQPGTGAILKHGIAGAAITPGQPLYRSGGKLLPADADVELSAAVVGISVNGASADGQPITYQDDGVITLGATAAMVVGTTYVVSTTAGGIAPQADLAAGDYVTVLGAARTAGTLKLAISVTGVTVPA